MNSEQLLIEKWRSLPEERQEEVMAFIEFLTFYSRPSSSMIADVSMPQAKLGEKLQVIRDKIVASGVPLLSPEEVEREKAERRGGYQGEQE